MNSAEFIKKNIDTWGAVGRNNKLLKRNQKNECIPKHSFTSKNHFVFGFNNNEFNFKISEADRYWTEYGSPSRRVKPFKVELLLSISEIYDSVGSISITSGNGHISELLAESASHLNFNFTAIRINIVDCFIASKNNKNEIVIEKRFNEFEEFAWEFASITNCIDPWIAFEAFHGEFSDKPHLYAGADIKIENQNFDKKMKKFVAPPNWTMSDHEKFTAINRFLAYKNKIGFPHILRHTPELICSQINSDEFRSLFLKNGGSEVLLNKNAWNNKQSQILLAQKTFPEKISLTSFKNKKSYPAFFQKMSALRLAMKTEFGDHGPGSQHTWPLCRLLKKMGIEEDFLNNDSLYGKVF